MDKKFHMQFIDDYLIEDSNFFEISALTISGKTGYVNY